MRRLSSLALSLFLLSACGTAERLSRIGRAPEMAAVESPTAKPDYHPVSMPMPSPREPLIASNSLWRPGSRTFLRDQRAAQVGDLVTILVAITDTADFAATTDTSRTGTDTMGAPSLLGLAASVGRIFPAGTAAASLVDTSSANAYSGAGRIKRAETVTMRVAATVTQLLPNGNLVVAGRQQMRVNHELRDLQVAGIIRPQDIGSDNTVQHDRLAEARISYGGKGTASDVQQPRYGQQVLDAILPF